MHVGRIVCLVVWTCSAAYGCELDATAETEGKRNRASIERSAADPAPKDEEPVELLKEGLVVGEYPLAPNPVIDGDTIRVEGFKRSIRLLSIDSEEIARSRRDRAAIKADFDEYLSRKRGDSVRPRKSGTPAGSSPG